jgi:hypothetical protein
VVSLPYVRAQAAPDSILALAARDTVAVMPRTRDFRTERIAFTVTPKLKLELETEAWESQRSLADYCRGLLERRGKWARSCGSAGGYDLQIPELARKKDDK